MDILCKRDNGNISSIETDLVELINSLLIRRIKLSIEGRLNKLNSKESTM